jgi:hypothetical protein
MQAIDRLDRNERIGPDPDHFPANWARATWADAVCKIPDSVCDAMDAMFDAGLFWILADLSRCHTVDHLSGALRDSYCPAPNLCNIESEGIWL